MELLNVNENAVRERRGERGVTILLVAICIFALMAMAALAIDVGVLFTARTSAQHAADAAALAGAYTFTLATNAQPASAQNAAIAVAAKNSVMGTPVTIVPADVVVDTALHRVTVTVHRTIAGSPINTFFAGVLGVNKMATEARAVAEAASAGTASRCVKPVFMPNTIFASDATVQAACNAGHKVFNTDGTVTAWAQAQNPIGKCLETRPTRPADANGTLAPGQYFSLDFGSGANTYRCSWGSCLNQCNVNTTVIQCGKPYPIKTGDMVGPTGQGVSDLIGSPPDLWHAVDQYYPGGDTSKTTDTSRSLSIIPIWDDCTPPGNTITTGTNGQSVNVLGFLEVFVDGQGAFAANCLGPANSGNGNGNGNGNNGNGNGGGGGGQPDWVKTHVVRQISCDAAGGAGAGTPATGPFGVPIRLVQVP
ncbi:MAG: helicase/secretion neighborhood TadE-like protein [Acidobacteriales bacterium]|nr:helicase/secretion neighborhood TadE-like protein [Terriglobales bacterium]